MANTIPVRIERDLLATLDLLVRLGVYSSRSEAIRELMKQGLEARKDVMNLGKIVKVIERLDKEGRIDLSDLKLERERF